MNQSKLDIQKVATIGLIFSLGLFPILKILGILLKFTSPLHFVFIVIFTGILTIQQLVRKNKLFFICNLYVSAYCLLTGLKLITPLENSNYKLFIAGYTFANLILIFFELAKSEDFKSYLALYMKLLAYISLFTFALMTTAGIALYLKNPFEWTFQNIIGLLTFSRDQVMFRATLLTRLNPVGLFSSIENVSYIGPQLLMQPLIFTLLKMTGLTKSIKLSLPKVAEISVYVFLGMYILIMNTRAFSLIISIFLIVRLVKSNSLFLKRLATVLFFIFPFSIYLLSSQAISARDCQFKLVKNEISALGNGIGSGIQILNNSCAIGNLIVDKMLSTLTISYDNIHLEFIHYFGYLTYLLLLVALLLNIKNSKNYLYFMSFLFVFMALNFNLFEVAFAPLILILYFYTFYKPAEEI